MTIEEQPQQSQLPTVLIVDDDPTNLQVTFELLKQIGISAKIAHNGERALQQLEHTSVDLILLDIMIDRKSVV